MSATIELDFIEALTEAGIKPEAAQKIKLAWKAEMHTMHMEQSNQLMTKNDGHKLELKMSDLRNGMAELRVEIFKAINDQTKLFIAFNGVMLAALFAALKFFSN